MFCIKCGAKIIEGSKFCTYCGTPVAKAHAKNETAGIKDTVDTAVPSTVEAVTDASTEGQPSESRGESKAVISLRKLSTQKRFVLGALALVVIVGVALVFVIKDLRLVRHWGKWQLLLRKAVNANYFPF